MIKFFLTASILIIPFMVYAQENLTPEQAQEKIERLVEQNKKMRQLLEQCSAVLGSGPVSDIIIEEPPLDYFEKKRLFDAIEERNEILRDIERRM